MLLSREQHDGDFLSRLKLASWPGRTPRNSLPREGLHMLGSSDHDKESTTQKKGGVKPPERWLVFRSLSLLIRSSGRFRGPIFTLVSRLVSCCSPLGVNDRCCG